MKKETKVMLTEASKVAYNVAGMLAEAEQFKSTDFLKLIAALENIQKAVEVAHNMEYGLE